MSIKHRMAAFSDLWQRYTDSFAFFWKRRHEHQSGLFNTDEAQFLPAALALQEQPVSSTLRWTAWLLMLMVVMVIGWAIMGRIDIIVNSPGKIIPSGYIKTIASVDVAAVTALHVEEGQTVHAGDLLIELDTTATDAEHDKAQSNANIANLQIARSKALIDAVDHLHQPMLPHVAGVNSKELAAEQSHLIGQYQDFRSKLDKIEANITQYRQDLSLATQQASDYKALAETHDVSDHAWLEKEQARIELDGKLTDAQHQRTALIASTKKDAYDALTDGTKQAVSSNEDARRAGEHSRLLALRAPVDGTVQQLTVHTIGGVVQAAQPLMLIVPEQKQVEVEAYVENKDIGFIHEGQPAAVKIDAFEYTKYGTVPAVVTHVSRDAIEDGGRAPTQNRQQDGASPDNGFKSLRYAVQITLDRNTMNIDGKTMTLSPGMSVNAEIKTGSRRIIDYILSPLQQHEHEALHER